LKEALENMSKNDNTKSENELKNPEFISLMKENEILKDQIKNLTEQQEKINNENTERPKAASVLQVQKNKEIVNETNSILESAQQNLAEPPAAETASPKENLVFSLSKSAEQELEKHVNFLKKVMRDISSATTNSLLMIFGSADALTQIVNEKDYENLLVLLCKVIANTIIAENVKSKDEKSEIDEKRSIRNNINSSPNDLKYDELKTLPPPTEPKGQQSLLRNSIEEYINSDSSMIPKNKSHADKSQENVAGTGVVYNTSGQQNLAENIEMKDQQQDENEKIEIAEKTEKSEEIQPVEIKRLSPSEKQIESRGRKMSPQIVNMPNSVLKELEKKRRLLAIYQNDRRNASPKQESHDQFEKSLRSNEKDTGPKPIFNNFTKRTTDFFDPFLQFGGESMYFCKN